MRKQDGYTYEELQSRWGIDQSSPESLAESMVEQTQLYGHCGAMFALAKSERDQKKFESELLEAKLNRDIRERLENNGEKVTEDKIKALIKLEPEYQKVYREYLDARFDADSWEELKDSYTQRSYMLKELATLRSSGYLDEMTVPRPVGRVRR